MSTHKPDINECGIDDCDVNANCIDSNGSYTCFCLSGYSGDGITCAGKIQVYLVTYYRFRASLFYKPLQILMSVVVIVTTVIFKQHVQTLMVATTVCVSLDTLGMEPLAMVL